MLDFFLSFFRESLKISKERLNITSPEFEPKTAAVFYLLLICTALSFAEFKAIYDLVSAQETMQEALDTCTELTGSPPVDENGIKGSIPLPRDSSKSFGYPAPVPILPEDRPNVRR